ncbi:MAG: beta-N-acetylhexosaminidase [Rhodobacteraceae bacterium]|nr:beta-N-acetylhexosaminidase [Paracoccaceae bacterium]
MTGATIFGCEGLELTADEAAFFRAADPFGFILFARNIDTPAQLRRLTGQLRESVGRDAVITIDQEGGRVQRLRGPVWREWQPPLETVQQAKDPVRAMWLQMRLIADELRALGIDSNCAPCADIAGGATHPFLKNRCYGTEPEGVSRIALAVADGLLAGGVLPVMKHLPGHGRATLDTHHSLPTVDVSPAALLAHDFAPFRALAHLPLAMTAHIVFSAYDSRPATQSPAMIRLIRDEIGFQGLLMTDDLNMEALSGTVAERAALSIAAGCDIALHCKGTVAEFAATAAAVGKMGAQAQQRAAAAVARRLPPVSVDIPALEAEFATLMGR